MWKGWSAVLFSAAFSILLGLPLTSEAFADDPGELLRRAQGNIGPVTYCVDPDWPPYEIINDQGQHEGIAADLLIRAALRGGVNLSLVHTKDWSESIAASKEGRCDLLSFLNQTSKREEWLIFTDPLFIDANVIVTREEHSFVADLASLSNEILVLPKGTSIEERVRRDFPNLTIIITETEAEAFAMVSERKADMTIRSLIVAVYTIKKEGWFNLKISGQVPGYENYLRVGVKKGDVLVRDALNRGIATITPAERAQIANRHVAIIAQTAIDYGFITKFVAVFSSIMLTNVFWVVKLRRANKRLLVLSQTDNLTRIANRAMLNERFGLEVERAQRYGRPLSAILIDVDYFKSINDKHGHLMGDQVLIAIAALVKANTRAVDTAGRWGGEEFLVICPETDTNEAMVVAGRIGDAIRCHAFGTGRTHTVSIGLATLRPGETTDRLIHRADHALYAAKNAGRDRVCVS